MCGNNAARNLNQQQSHKTVNKKMQDINCPEKILKPQVSDISSTAAIQIIPKPGANAIYTITDYGEDSNDLSLIQEQIDDDNAFGT